MFWVISVYFNIRNTLPKSGTFLLGHPVYVCVCVYIFTRVLQPRTIPQKTSTLLMGPESNIKNIWTIIKQLLLSTELLSTVLELTLFTNFGIIISVRYSVIIINQQHGAYNACRQNVAHLRQECHNSKFGHF